MTGAGGRPATVLAVALGILLAVAVGTPVAAAEVHVLAASWQPAFCETRPAKPECLSQTEDRVDATGFSLHGLWPQPVDNVYCGVPPELRAVDEAGRWADLPSLDLEAETREALDRLMPGSASLLDRHEWIKHGTCHSRTAETYYRNSLRLMAELNASPVRSLFAESIGLPLSARAIRERFDSAFGDGAGDRVHVICRRVGARRLIVELKINLGGAITPERDLATLLQDAPRAFRGCDAGIVDRVGIGLGDPER